MCMSWTLTWIDKIHNRPIILFAWGREGWSFPSLYSAPGSWIWSPFPRRFSYFSQVCHTSIDFHYLEDDCGPLERREASHFWKSYNVNWSTHSPCYGCPWPAWKHSTAQQALAMPLFPSSAPFCPWPASFGNSYRPHPVPDHNPHSEESFCRWTRGGGGVLYTDLHWHSPESCAGASKSSSLLFLM